MSHPIQNHMKNLADACERESWVEEDDPNIVGMPAELVKAIIVAGYYQQTALRNKTTDYPINSTLL